MKRHFLLAILSLFLFSARGHCTPASLVIDAETGRVLLRQNANVANYPASLTKIMTLYVTYSAIRQGLLDWDDTLYVSSYASRQPKSKLYLKKGDTMTVEEAVKAMIVRSANDAAVVIAEAIGGTEENFAEIMNGFAQILGLEKTSFSNATGLSEEGYSSSAADIARLSVAIMNHFPEHYDLFSLQEFTFKGKRMRTTNNILRTYKGAEGMKTGYTNKAGYNLVCAASNENGRVIAVTMDRRSVRDRDASMRRLLDGGLKKLATVKSDEDASLQIERAELRGKSEIKKNIRHSRKLAAASEEERRELMVKKDDGGSWGIQVGAFFQRQQALNAAETVFSKYFDSDFGKEIKAEKSKTPSGKIIYRAVIAGLSKYNAYEVCVDYRKCLVVRQNGKIAELKK